MQKCFGLLPEDINFVAPNGEVSEWSIEHAWKACVPQGTAGSNPALSAKPSSKDEGFFYALHLLFLASNSLTSYKITN